MMKAGVSKKSENDETFVFIVLFHFYLFHHPPNHRGRCLRASSSVQQSSSAHQWIMEQLICRLGIVECAMRDMSGL